MLKVIRPGKFYFAATRAPGSSKQPSLVKGPIARDPQSRAAIDPHHTMIYAATACDVVLGRDYRHYSALAWRTRGQWADAAGARDKVMIRPPQALGRYMAVCRWQLLREVLVVGVSVLVAIRLHHYHTNSVAEVVARSCICSHGRQLCQHIQRLGRLRVCQDLRLHAHWCSEDQEHGLEVMDVCSMSITSQRT